MGIHVGETEVPQREDNTSLFEFADGIFRTSIFIRDQLLKTPVDPERLRCMHL